MITEIKMSSIMNRIEKVDKKIRDTYGDDIEVDIVDHSIRFNTEDETIYILTRFRYGRKAPDAKWKYVRNLTPMFLQKPREKKGECKMSKIRQPAFPEDRLCFTVQFFYRPALEDYSANSSLDDMAEIDETALDPNRDPKEFARMISEMIEDSEVEIRTAVTPEDKTTKI